MSTTDVRRPARARKTVQSYADEQADSIEQPAVKKQLASERKRTITADEDGADDAIKPPPAKLTSKSSKRASASKQLDPGDNDEGLEPQPFMTYPKHGKPPPLEQQIRIKPHSKIYPVPDQVQAKARAWHGLAAETRIERARSNIKPLAPGEEETSLRPHVPFATEDFNAILERATTHKTIVLNRERQFEEDCHAGHEHCPCEVLKIAGSKDDVYTITVSHLPSCTCLVGLFTRKSSEYCCKHIIYVLHQVLKVSEPLKYQNAFLTSELRDIFAQAPELPNDVAADTVKDGNRKPVADDCPICSTPLEDKETVWCKASCGNNVHKSCFEHWAKTKPGNVTCVYCRAQWEDEGKQKIEVTGVEMPMERSASGYYNVRHLLDYD